MLAKYKTFLAKLKPRFYKKTFFIGQRSIIKFTGDGIRKFFTKLIWVIVVTVMLISMVLGGLALTQSQNTVIIN